MFKKIIFYAMLAVLPFGVPAQFTLSGRVTDARSGQGLPGAHIVLQGFSKASVSHDDGSFALKRIPEGDYILRVSYLGYQTYSKALKIDRNLYKDVSLDFSTLMQDEVIVKSTRADMSVPTSYVNIERREIEKLNTGRDLPYLLDQTPSVLVTSDGGTGVGYTSLRIRGSDISRINVMVNGIPLNDPESQVVYWVDLPDFASSTDNIQVQRGVGTSVNGAGAFGGSINLQTQEMPQEPGAKIHASAGSFSTFRNSVQFATGRSLGRFAMEGRLSRISSEGYIDRASSELKSFFVSAGYFGEKSLVRLNVFGGKEITYQAWEGVPSELLERQRTFNPAGLYLGPDGDTLYYENQVDDYQQDHYQLFYSLMPVRGLTLNLAGHYTRGFGFYESYRQEESFTEYGLSDVILGGDTLFTTDLVRRKHLDNDFYGSTFSLLYDRSTKWKLAAGGAYNEFKGWHFGRIVWARYASDGGIEKDYYRNRGIKKDLNSYLKLTWQAGTKLGLFGDVQYRRVTYSMRGTHDDLRVLDQDHSFDFFNPKAGLTLTFNPRHRGYASVAVAHREPSRNDYRDADPGRQPVEERLTNFELGYEFTGEHTRMTANAYWMQYKDQLVLTGEINNVGNPVMVNIPDSYRAGIEIQISRNLGSRLKAMAHLSLSRNKIKEFTEYIDNWDTWGQETRYHESTDIAFSPSLIAGYTVQWSPGDALSIRLNGKYAGRQFIDNTSSPDKTLDPWWTTDLRADYSFSLPYVSSTRIFLSVINLFDHAYESNAWVYSYLYQGKEYKLDGYFPQAGIHFMAGLELGL